MLIQLSISTLLCFSYANAQSGQNLGNGNKIKPLPKELESRLALSALPPHLRNGATVYILNPDKGFEIARKGTNGLHAFVSRNGDDAMRGLWPLKVYRDDILYPISFDEAGAKSIMPVFFDIAKLQADGTAPNELKKIIQDRYKNKYYKAPERAGVSYMLSPILRTYTNPDSNENVITASIPHIMYYSPNITNEQIGGGKPEPGANYPFVILPGPHGYSIQFLGKTEAEAVRTENKELLKMLSKLNSAWTLPETGKQPVHMHHH